jgi:hypothetical protein
VQCREHFSQLTPLVSELGIQRFLSRKCTLGALNFCRLVARPEPPMPSSSTETAQVEVSRAAHEEGTVPEAPARVNTVETLPYWGQQAPACPRMSAAVEEMRQALVCRCVWASFLNLQVFEGIRL